MFNPPGSKENCPHCKSSKMEYYGGTPGGFHFYYRCSNCRKYTEWRQGGLPLTTDSPGHSCHIWLTLPMKMSAIYGLPAFSDFEPRILRYYAGGLASNLEHGY